MAYFTPRFETAIVQHMVGTMRYSAVLLDPALNGTAPLPWARK